MPPAATAPPSRRVSSSRRAERQGWREVRRQGRGRPDGSQAGHHGLRGLRGRRQERHHRPTLSNTAFQAQPIAQEGKTPVLAISNTASGITEQGDYIFRDSLTEAQVIPQTVKKAKEKYNLTKVVVMYSNDDAFTESGFKVFEEASRRRGSRT